MAEKRKLGRTCVRTIPGDDTADVLRLEYEGGRRPVHAKDPRFVAMNWRRTPASWWTHFYAARTYCGRRVGTRRLHGKPHTIVEVNGRFYAQDPRKMPRRR